MSFVIKNATVVSPADGCSGRMDIKIENGKIAAVGENLSGDTEINAEGLYAIRLGRYARAPARPGADSQGGYLYRLLRGSGRRRDEPARHAEYQSDD